MVSAIALLALCGPLLGDPPRRAQQRCDDAILVPPTDFDGSGNAVHFDTEVAVEDAAVPQGEVDDEARRKLLDKLCQAESRDACGALLARTNILWRGAGPKTRCAMAGINTRVIDAWRAAQVPDLRGRLLAALQDVLPRRAGVRVVLDQIEDSGANGGNRAAWLRSQVEAGLRGVNAIVVEPSPSWDGRGVPKGADRVLRARIVERHDPVRGLPIIEVSITAAQQLGPNLAKRTADPFEVAAVALPRGPSPVAEIRERGEVTVHLRTHGDGNLCNGEQSTLWVGSNAWQPLHVRVFNLDAEGNVLQLFPSEPGKDVLTGGELVDEVVEVQGAPGTVERFVVVAAPTVLGLGRFATTTGVCRLAAAEAEAARRGEGFTQPHVGVTSFRVLEAGRCDGSQARAPSASLRLDQLDLCR